MLFLSITHIIGLLSCTLIYIILFSCLKNKSIKVKNATITSLLFLSLLIHFIKLLIPEYRNNLPTSLISLTPETLCAASTIAFPFIYLSKNKAFKDYMVIFGIISGALTLLFPLDIIKNTISTIEIIRFFFAHLVIFVCPLLMLTLGIHKPTKKWIKHTLLILLLMINIVILNTIIMTYILNGKEALETLVKPLYIMYFLY